MRIKQWSQTEYVEREQDWAPHDLIIEELAKFPGHRAATEEEDHHGVDLWKEIPFDVKITDGVPKTYKGFNDDLELFKWLLEHQDLDRFHPTNRIIVVSHKGSKQLKQEDAQIIAQYIDQAFIFSRYFVNVDYTLVGNGNQTQHPHYGKRHTMKIGLLIHYH